MRCESACTGQTLVEIAAAVQGTLRIKLLLEHAAPPSAQQTSESAHKWYESSVFDVYSCWLERTFSHSSCLRSLSLILTL